MSNGEEEKPNCTKCNGSGMEYQEYQTPSGGHGHRYVTCTACNGSGKQG